MSEPTVNDSGIAGPKASDNGATGAALRGSRGAQLLAAALGVQLLVAGALAWRSGADAGVPTASALVDGDGVEVDGLRIEGDDTAVALRRGPEGWRFEGEPGWPADTARIDALIDDLESASPGLPVASSTASRGQLEVADDAFRRRLTLKAGDAVVADLLIGTSPGLRRSHVRRAGDDAIYAARLDPTELPASVDDWLDRSLLSFADIDRLEADGIALRNDGTAWAIAGPAGPGDPRRPDPDAIGTVVAALEGLRVVGTGGTPEASNDIEPAREGDDEAPAEAIELVVGAGGDIVTLSLAKRGDEVRASRDDVAGEFVVDPSLFETLSGVNADALLLAETPDAPAEPAGTPASDAAPDAAPNATQAGGQGAAVAIDAPWARATAGVSRPGAAYWTVRNDGQAPAVIAGVDVDADVAAGASLHRTVTDEAGVSRMEPLDELTIPAQASVAFEPGGNHVMLEGLREPLVAGRSVVLTLRLADGATLDVDVPVLGAAARGPGEAGG